MFPPLSPCGCCHFCACEFLFGGKNFFTVEVFLICTRLFKALSVFICETIWLWCCCHTSFRCTLSINTFFKLKARKT